MEKEITYSDLGLTIEQVIEICGNLPETEMIKFGVLRKEYRNEYESLLKKVEDTNGKETLDGISKKHDNEIKGKSLEELVKCLFIATGDYFNIYTNLRTSTNEIDLLIGYNEKGEALLSNKLDNRYKLFLCECKNHKKGPNVEYVGKFYSLVETSSVKLGILFSWKEVCGTSKWSSSKGLIHKICMLKERSDEKIYIINFFKKDYYRILNGDSFFKIVKEKVIDLLCDVNIGEIPQHENQEEIIKAINSLSSNYLE